MSVTLGKRALLNADLVLVAGASNMRSIRFSRRLRDANGSLVETPVDLSGWTACCQIRRDGHLLLDISEWVSLSPSGLVVLDPPPSSTADLTCWSAVWDLVLSSPDGRVVRLAAGLASIVPVVSRRLP